EEAPGMVFWHPRGLALYRMLEGVIQRHVRRDGFLEVRTPQVLRRSVWETSGHLRHAGQHMFLTGEGKDASAIKPVSCPGHMELFKHRSVSYRELPVRYAELGVVHRDEPSGTLHGLFRLRQFTQDDGHIFCEGEHVAAEIERFARSLEELYAALGFAKLEVWFASRPDDREGSDAVWDRAEALLLQSAKRAGLSPKPAPKSGAFYGPKLEITLADRLGRSWQCGTIQIDLVLPERFDVESVTRSGGRARPVLLHRATLGSLERFLGVLLEHHANELPPWLAPEQAAVLPVTASDREYGARAAGELSDAGVRVRLDDRDESLSKKVLASHEAASAFVLVVGPREAASETVSLRDGA